MRMEDAPTSRADWKEEEEKHIPVASQQLAMLSVLLLPSNQGIFPAPNKPSPSSEELRSSTGAYNTGML